MRHHLYFLISVLGYTSITLAWREIEDDIYDDDMTSYVPCYHSRLRELPPRKRKGARPCSDNATTTLRQSRAQRKRNNIYTTLASKEFDARAEGREDIRRCCCQLVERR